MVRYLGGIREGDIKQPLSAGRFWQQVDGALDQLGIRGPERVTIEGKISAKVPRPDPVVLERTRQEFEV
jgi:hypothetical protein